MYPKSKDTTPENIYKAFVGGEEGFTCNTFKTHLYLLFNIVTMDSNSFSEPGNEVFLSSVVEVSRLLS
jgi:hypothetical protein